MADNGLGAARRGDVFALYAEIYALRLTQEAPQVGDACRPAPGDLPGGVPEVAVR